MMYVLALIQTHTRVYYMDLTRLLRIIYWYTYRNQNKNDNM